MNIPPAEAVRVEASALRQFAGAVMQRLGLTVADAAQVAEALVATDLRGIRTHGTRQLATYQRQFAAGELNPRPRVTVANETPTTLVVDGDGGLGYGPAFQATRALVDKCREHGVAAAVTRNHGHIGAAGLYVREAIAAGLIGFATSGHELRMTPERTLAAAAGGPPMAFGIPAGDGPPLVLDFGAMIGVQPDALLAMAPGLVFRCIGLGAVCQALGGFLTGLPVPPEHTPGRAASTNHGAFFGMLDPRRFLPGENFERTMAAYLQQAAQLQPLPGFAPPQLPGGPEWERERAWAQDGIPVDAAHREVLERVARELDVPEWAALGLGEG